MASVFVFGLVFSLSDIVPAHAMSMKDLLEMSEGREVSDEEANEKLHELKKKDEEDRIAAGAMPYTGDDEEEKKPAYDKTKAESYGMDSDTYVDEDGDTLLTVKGAEKELLRGIKLYEQGVKKLKNGKNLSRNDVEDIVFNYLYPPLYDGKVKGWGTDAFELMFEFMAEGKIKSVHDEEYRYADIPACYDEFYSMLENHELDDRTLAYLVAALYKKETNYYLNASLDAPYFGQSSGWALWFGGKEATIKYGLDSEFSKWSYLDGYVSEKDVDNMIASHNKENNGNGKDKTVYSTDSELSDSSGSKSKVQANKTKLSYSTVKNAEQKVIITTTGLSNVKFSNKTNEELKSFVKVSKKGKVTFKKGAPKGTYKIKVTGTIKGSGKKVSKTIKIKIK